MVLHQNLETVLNEIIKEVEAASPGVVVVDSFRTVVRKTETDTSEMELQSFVQRLALHLSSWQATTFLIGEYAEAEIRDNPVFTVADGLFWLFQQTERNSIVRKLQIMKLRGQASVPGLHTFRITSDGVQAFPRTLGLMARKKNLFRTRRLSTGVPKLDELLGGGIPEGDSVLVAGASGTGKSVLATQFLSEGIRQGESAIAAVFEERPQEYAARAENFGLDLLTAQRQGKLEIIYLRPLDLSVDETMQEIMDAVQRLNAKRLVIDSLAGFEMALAPAFRTDFRESLYRMIGALTGMGVTILSTAEIEESFTEFAFSTYSISFLTDDILRFRFAEINGELRKVLVVVKMRGGNHSKEIHEFDITPDGIVIDSRRLTGYRGLISGIPEPQNWVPRPPQHAQIADGPQKTQKKIRPAPKPRARK
jgi:circadian clock protein KaiC